ncbi:hypothetical protein [Devosia sp. A449]
MAILMPNLTKANNGDWFARKAIPPDVRDAYQRAYGVRQEVRFRRSGLSTGQAKFAFAEWVAEVEGRIESLRSARAGEPQHLTQRQAHALVGRWYDWFIARHEDHPQPVEVWDHQLERYRSALEAFGIDEVTSGNHQHGIARVFWPRSPSCPGCPHFWRRKPRCSIASAMRCCWMRWSPI